MSADAWVTMILVMVYVWGGCALAVVMAMSKESAKPHDDL